MSARHSDSSAEHRTPVSTPRRPDASMSLLNDVMRNSDDAEYRDAAARQPSSAPASVPRNALILLLALGLGVLLSGAIVNLRGPTAALQESRAVLVQEVADRTERADALAADIDGLSAEISALQEEALQAEDPELLVRLDELEVVSGASAVTGPGLTVRLSDAPDDGLGVDPESRVQDLDLQVVVNGLWAAGAEAIAINGQRLTSLSAIRHVQQAILVDLVPVSSPYTVSALGNTQDLQIAFARGAAASHLTLLSSRYGIASSVKGERELTIPGVGTTILRHATVVDTRSSKTSEESP
jgi:uncharacterized protein YlxW (UPF0749 family)